MMKMKMKTKNRSYRYDINRPMDADIMSRMYSVKYEDAFMY